MHYFDGAGSVIAREAGSSGAVLAIRYPDIYEAQSALYRFDL